jgi:hypothetical protein
MRLTSRVVGVAGVAWSLVVAWQATSSATGRRDEGEFRAPGLLSQTGLYRAGSTTAIAPGNRPFAPQYPLWTDGAVKRRWVSMPQGAVIDGVDETAWVMPVGTRFWKEFSFGGRKVETRFLWRASADRWVLASYVWNEAGTEATLAPERGVPGAADLGGGKRHSVPATSDCLACHGTRPGPLGFNALQLSPDRDPRAIHAEPLTPGMLTLDTLAGEGTLVGARADMLTRPPRIVTAAPETRAVLGYLLANCGSCHNGRGEISALGPTIRPVDLLTDGDRVARSLVNQRTTWQVPGAEHTTSVVVNVQDPQLSALLVRMRSRRPSSQMPPLGTVVRDDEAVTAITEWVGLQARSTP